MRQNIERFIILWPIFTFGIWLLGAEYFNIFISIFGGFITSIGYILILKKSNINLNWLKILAFIPTFCYYSFMGAIGVARLAIKPNLKLNPFFYTLPLNPKNSHHALIANIYSLMPGTLSVDIKPNQLKLHILDKTLFDEALILSLHVRLQSFQKALK